MVVTTMDSILLSGEKQNDQSCMNIVDTADKCDRETKRQNYVSKHYTHINCTMV